MKPVIKAVIAFSSLALAGVAMAQTSPTSPASPTTTPSDSSSSSSTTTTPAPAPKRDVTPSTPRSSTMPRNEGARPGGVAQNNPGANPKEGPSPNQKEGSTAGTTTERTATGPASASPTRGGGIVTFQSLDTNKDGKLSKTEAEADPDLARDFTKLDKNRDGMLDQSEHRGHKTK